MLQHTTSKLYFLVLYIILIALIAAGYCPKSHAQAPVFNSLQNSNLIFLNPGFIPYKDYFSASSYYLHRQQGYHTVVSSIAMLLPRQSGTSLAINSIVDDARDGNRLVDLSGILTKPIMRRWPFRTNLGIGVHWQHKRTELNTASNRYAEQLSVDINTDPTLKNQFMSLETGLVVHFRNFFAGVAVKNINRPVEASLASDKWRMPRRISIISGLQSTHYRWRIQPIFGYEHQPARLKIDSLDQALIEELRYVSATMHFRYYDFSSALGYRFIFPGNASYHAEVGYNYRFCTFTYNLGMSPNYPEARSAWTALHQISVSFNPWGCNMTFECHRTVRFL